MKLHSRQKTYLLIGLGAVLVIGLYLNRAYAHIYNRIQAGGLKSVDSQIIYNLPSIPNMDNNTKVGSSLVYVALGDSLTSGVGADRYEESYPYLLAQKLAGEHKNVKLEAFSFPGATTADLLAEVLPAAIKAQPDIVTLLIGVNDIHSRVSADAFQSHYEEILSRLAKETKAKIYVINIPLIGSRSLLLPPYDYLFRAQTEKFNRIIYNLSQKYQVTYLDLYTPTASLLKEDGDHYSVDSFHPSAKGYKFWSDIIYAGINQ